MTLFNYYGGLCGGNRPFCARIKLSENVDVAKGEMLYYDPATLTVTPEKGTLEIAGVCANTYKAEKNDLCPEYGEGYVSVILSKDALYTTAPFVVQSVSDTAVSDIKTDIAYTDTMTASGLVGAKLVLAEKADASVNSGEIGCEYEITSVKGEGGKTTFVIDCDSGIATGDRYILIPPYGFTMFGLDSDGKLCLEENGDFTVMDANAVGYVLGFNA